MELIVSDKKEQYRVVRPWVGGPELGDVIDGPVHPAIRSHVELVRGKVKGADTGAANEESAAIIAEAEKKAAEYLQEAIDSYNADRDRFIEEAKAEAAKILDQARSDADAILNDAKAEAEKILEDARNKASNKR